MKKLETINLANYFVRKCDNSQFRTRKV